MQKNRLIFAMLAAMILLAGCDDDNSQQLKDQLAACEQGSAKLVAQAQSEVNLAFAYSLAGPLKYLPIWPASAVQQGQSLTNTVPAQEIKQPDGTRKTVDVAPALQPDWGGYALVGTLWAGLAAVLGAGFGAAWLMFIRLVRPAQSEVDEALKLIGEADASLQAKREAQERVEVAITQAQKRLAAIKSEITNHRAELQDLLEQVEQARQDHDLLSGFSPPPRPRKQKKPGDDGKKPGGAGGTLPIIPEDVDW